MTRPKGGFSSKLLLLGSSLMLAGFAEAAHAEEPKIYFQENFRNYSERPPVMADLAGLSIGNDPVWTQRAEINAEAKTDGLILRAYQPALSATRELNDFDVVFDFQLKKVRESTDVGAFDLRLRRTVSGKEGDLVIGFTSNQIKITGEGPFSGVNGGGPLPFDLEAGRWHTCVVAVRGGKMTVHLDEERVMKVVADTAIPASIGAAVNFKAYANLPFSIAELVVRTPGPLPDHRISNLLPAPFRIDTAAFKAGASVKVPANDVFGASIQAGRAEGVEMLVHWSDGQSSALAFKTAGFPDGRFATVDGKRIRKGYEWPDALIRVTGLGDVKKPLIFHVRPKLRRYHTSYSYTDTYYDLTRDWELLPSASQHPLKVELRRHPQGVDVYLDGSYAGRLEGSGVREVTFNAAGDGAVGPAFSLKTPHDPARYLPLDVAAQRMGKAFAAATASLPPGLSNVQGVPMWVATPEGSADVGLTREGQGNWALEVDEYTARSPFDGFLTSIHFGIPGGTLYTKAWVLCAVEPDPDKDPILTTRIAKYKEDGVGGNQLADTTLTLPRNGEASPGMKVVGSVTTKDRSGKPVEVPLYLVEVPLNGGKIIDLMMEQPSLDFEFFGKPWINFEQVDNSIKPDPNSRSAVQIFGVTLEKAPVGLAFVQSQPANIFHNQETPTTTAVLTSQAPAKGKLVWEILDDTGKNSGGGSRDFAMAKAGVEQKVEIPLSVSQVGWYELKVSLVNAQGETLLTHPASFAVLGQDERKAKYDSPFGTWWFDGAHGTPSDPAFAGPVMFKAGIRKASWTKATESDMAPWSITRGQLNTPFDFRDLKDPQAAMQKAEETFRKMLEKYPNAREVAVFHESGPGNDLPVELFGLKPQLSEWRTGQEKRYADLLNLNGAFFREKFPQMKLVVGNNSASQAVMAAILRHGGKPEYIDYIGIESPSQVYIPEKLQEWALQGMHIAKDTVKTISGKEIPATGCYEFTYRTERDMGMQQHAEWYVRDMLISLANDFTLISPGILFDTRNAYYNGLWGGSGLLQRAPYGYPKKAYVAYAALTNVFDRVKFRRQIPTGSNTVYAVEFDRTDKKLATALWAARGNAEFTVEFAADTAVRVVDLYGRSREERTEGKKLKVTAGTAPVYLLADREISTVVLTGRSFPKDAARAALAGVAAKLDSINDVALDPDNGLDTPLKAPLQTPVRKRGEFELRAVNDEEKGNSLELRIDGKEHPGRYITEYATLRLNQPAEIKGTPAALGVWVKGNSNWGRILFEIEDAQGEIWRSLGTAGWGCDILDWPGNAAVNFDGWNFVSLALRETKLFNDHSPGPVSEQWVSLGGDKTIQYPIKLRALIVEMNRTPLNLRGFEAAEPVLRLKNAGGIYED